MTPITHFIVGLALGHLLAQFKISSFPYTHTLALASLLSLLPDINTLWGTKISEHHKDMTHYPMFWIVLAAIVFIIEGALDSHHTTSILVLLGSLTHLFLDTFGMTIGIYWLYPFSNTEYSFTKLDKSNPNLSNKERVTLLFKSWMIWLEIGVIAISIVVLLLFY